jgi:hypothetical protein
MAHVKGCIKATWFYVENFCSVWIEHDFVLLDFQSMELSIPRKTRLEIQLGINVIILENISKMIRTDFEINKKSRQWTISSSNKKEEKSYKIEMWVNLDENKWLIFKFFNWWLGEKLIEEIR